MKIFLRYRYFKTEQDTNYFHSMMSDFFLVSIIHFDHYIFSLDQFSMFAALVDNR
jgi:hypothetical protein